MRIREHRKIIYGALRESGMLTCCTHRLLQNAASGAIFDLTLPSFLALSSCDRSFQFQIIIREQVVPEKFTDADPKSAGKQKDRFEGDPLRPSLHDALDRRIRHAAFFRQTVLC